MTVDLVSVLAGRAGLSSSRTGVLERLLMRVQELSRDAVAILLSGSFRHCERPLDIDLMVVLPPSDRFERFLVVDRSESIKAEVFFDNLDSLKARLQLERRNNMNGLESFLEASINLCDDRGELPPDILDLLNETRVQWHSPRPVSRSYMGAQFEQALFCLATTQSPSDRISISTDVLHLLRQTFHVLRGEWGDASLKHFLRRLESQEPAFHQALIEATARCQGEGDSEEFVHLIRRWMADNCLVAPKRLCVRRNVVEVQTAG